MGWEQHELPVSGAFSSWTRAGPAQSLARSHKLAQHRDNLALCLSEIPSDAWAGHAHRFGDRRLRAAASNSAESAWYLHGAAPRPHGLTCLSTGVPWTVLQIPSALGASPAGRLPWCPRAALHKHLPWTAAPRRSAARKRGRRQLGPCCSDPCTRCSRALRAEVKWLRLCVLARRNPSRGSRACFDFLTGCSVV